MLPTDWVYVGWSNSGEIDIMENVGYLKDSIFGAIHTGPYNGAIGTQKVNSILKEGSSKKFHVFALESTAEDICFYVDNERFNFFKNEHKGTAEWPFDKEFHLLMNIAVGGNWGKFGVDDTIFPQQLVVDYVLMYQ